MISFQALGIPVAPSSLTPNVRADLPPTSDARRVPNGNAVGRSGRARCYASRVRLLCFPLATVLARRIKIFFKRECLPVLLSNVAELCQDRALGNDDIGTAGPA